VCVYVFSPNRLVRESRLLPAIFQIIEVSVLLSFLVSSVCLIWEAMKLPENQKLYAKFENTKLEKLAILQKCIKVF